MCSCAPHASSQRIAGARTVLSLLGWGGSGGRTLAYCSCSKADCPSSQQRAQGRKSFSQLHTTCLADAPGLLSTLPASSIPPFPCSSLERIVLESSS